MSDDYVVLLHGLGSTRWSMCALERTLSRKFRVINIGYPSRKYPVEQLAEYIGKRIRRHCTDEDRAIHFVTHSLGGIVLRYYLKEHQLPHLGRVVMFSPPNQGSELVDIFKRHVLFQIATGPAGRQLGTEPSSLPNRLGPVDFTVGVIAGNGSLNPVFSRLIPGADDGRVAVERTKVEGMTDFVAVRRHHSFIVYSSEVVRQTVYFLEHGEFQTGKERVR